MKLEFKFRDSQLTSPAKVDHNIYDPNLETAESLDVLNGHLDHDNIDFVEDQALPLNSIRRGALFRGKMVGSTLNADYYKKLNNFKQEGDWEDFTDESSESIQPIPGSGIEFYTPTSGTVLLTWQVSYSSDLDVKMSKDDLEYSTEASIIPYQPYGFGGEYVVGQDPKIRASRGFLTLMSATGDEMNLSEIGFRQYFPQSILGDLSLDPQRYLGMGRIWSGHYMFEATEQTWHRYGVGVFSTANMARMRIRNFKYLFFPNATATINP
jgi:hypothetical protein